MHFTLLESTSQAKGSFDADSLPTRLSLVSSDDEAPELSSFDSGDKAPELSFFDPDSISRVLSDAGFEVAREVAAQIEPVEPEPTLRLVRKVVSLFQRTTAISDNILKLRLGSRWSEFEPLLPDLLDSRLLREVEYVGGGKGRRFRLGVTNDVIESALRNCNGSLHEFMTLIRAA
jgi:hypothetical protein